MRISSGDRGFRQQTSWWRNITSSHNTLVGARFCKRGRPPSKGGTQYSEYAGVTALATTKIPTKLKSELRIQRTPPLGFTPLRVVATKGQRLLVGLEGDIDKLRGVVIPECENRNNHGDIENDSGEGLQGPKQIKRSPPRRPTRARCRMMTRPREYRTTPLLSKMASFI